MFDVKITIPNMDQPTPEAAAQAARRFLVSEGMLHDLTFEARGRRASPMDRRPSAKAVTLKGHEVELPLMLVLSTGHVTPSTAKLLEDDEAGVIRHNKGEYGWIIPIIDRPSNDPPPNLKDLVGIYAYARVLGATWIMLDRDAETIDALPSWSW